MITIDDKEVGKVLLAVADKAAADWRAQHPFKLEMSQEEFAERLGRSADIAMLKAVYDLGVSAGRLVEACQPEGGVERLIEAVRPGAHP